jgi:glycosyltransferase involved in cell wall biosynthesis
LLKEKPNTYPLSWTGLAKIFGFFQVARAILKFSPDIISINRERDIKRIYYIARVMGLLMKKRPVMVAIFQNIGVRIRFRIEKLDGLLFLNDYTFRDYVTGNPDAQTKSIIINYGIRIPEIDTRIKFDQNRPRSIFPGVLYPLIGMVGEFRKNQTELIDVAFHLKKKYPNFTIALIGKGANHEIKPLQEKIERLGLSKHFLFTGGIAHERIPEVFHDLDLSVSTNRAEAFGLVFIESLASYTPLVAFDSGGPVEILAKGGGVLVHGGAEEMAEKLALLIEDHAKLKSLGMEGRAVAEKYFSINAMGEKHLTFYQNLLNART